MLKGKQKSNRRKIKLFLFLLLTIGAFSRLYRLNWDEGYYLHPDERLYVNASNLRLPQSIQEFFSPDSPLNPKMFYYGQFPLYLYVFFFKLSQLFHFSLPFLYLSRLISALFNITTLFLLFLVARFFLPPFFALLALTFLVFSTGHLQHAYFNTTESILTFLVCFILLLSLKILQAKKLNHFHVKLLGIINGLAVGSKITGLSFLIIPLTSFLLRPKGFFRKIWLFGFFYLIFALISSPYNLIDFKNFQAQQNFMQRVTYGNIKAPFVIIYERTTPYFYQLAYILPFQLSLPVLFFSLLGWLLLLLKLAKEKKHELIVLLIFPTFYFLWTGAWYSKFARYMIPLLPFLSLFAAYFFYWLKEKQPKKKWVIYFFIFFTLFIQINYFLSFFINIYTKPHTRIEASNWIYQNIPPGKTIAVEHWDDPLPLPIPQHQTLFQSYQFKTLPVYDKPDDQVKMEKLLEMLASADYIIFSSRRVSLSIRKNPELYPLTAKFYDKLLNQELGFHLEKVFARKFNLFGFEFSDDSADETIQSYDHPPVYIFKNQAYLTSRQLLKQLAEPNK